MSDFAAIWASTQADDIRKLVDETRQAIDSVCWDRHGGAFPDCAKCRKQFPTYYAFREWVTQ